MSNPHKDEVFNTLTEFGFQKSQIESGWLNAPIQTIEGIIEYLESHPVDSNPTQTTAVVNSDDKTPDKPGQSFVQNIGHLVKPEIVNEIKSQGFSQTVSEKAALFSGNKDVQNALNWILQNQKNPDFEDPVQIAEDQSGPKLSKEEALFKALEMQKKIREEISEKEKQAQLESEKLRIKMGKEMCGTQRIIAENKKKLEMEEYLREKLKTESEKEQMLRIMEEDKIKRFGKATVHVEKPKTLDEKFKELYGKLYKAYRLGGIETLKGCLGMIRLYLENIAKNPAEEKFRKINSTNQKFCEKVKDVAGGVPMLNLVGFKEENGFFVMPNPNVAELREISGLIEIELHKLS